MVLFNRFTLNSSAGRESWPSGGQRARQVLSRRSTALCAVGCYPRQSSELEERSRYASIPQYARHFARMGVSARDTCVSGPDAATLQAGIAAHEQVLDETIVRAITPDDTAESILELLRACAPM